MTDIIETTETEETPRAQAMAVAAAKKKAPAQRHPSDMNPAAHKAPADRPSPIHISTPPPPLSPAESLLHGG